jgi:hypothetical protein
MANLIKATGDFLGKKPIMIISILLIVLSFILAGCSGSFYDDEIDSISEDFEEEYNADENTVLEVKNINGDIIIQAEDIDKIVLYYEKISYESKDQLNKVDVIVTEVDSEIIIETRYKTESREATVNMVIQVPDFINVSVVETTNGEIELSNTHGDVELKTTNGDISASYVYGEVTASTTNGVIDVMYCTKVGNITSTNGRIGVQVRNFDSDILIETTNGHIMVSINPELDADLFMKTNNGEIYVNDIDLTLTKDEDSHLEGCLGSCGNQITIETSNGNIVLGKLIVKN